MQNFVGRFEPRILAWRKISFQKVQILCITWSFYTVVMICQNDQDKSVRRLCLVDHLFNYFLAVTIYDFWTQIESQYNKKSRKRTQFFLVLNIFFRTFVLQKKSLKHSFGRNPTTIFAIKEILTLRVYHIK